MSTFPYSVRKLSRETDTSSFCCGIDEWDKVVADFLIDDAHSQQSMGLNVTWLFYKDDDLIGYTSLVSSDLRLEKTSNWKALLGLGGIIREHIPCILIAQFGVSMNYQHQGIGAEMLSWIRGAALTSSFGVKLLTLHVDRRNQNGRTFWDKQGFLNFPPGGGSGHLFMVFDLYGA